MRTTMLVALGGAIGAAVRWALAELVNSDIDAFPWPTLTVNIAGCALIGIAARRLRRSSDAWAFAATGVLGGLTTFSAFAAETRSLLDAQRHGLAVIYVTVSLVAGIGAVELTRGDRS